MRKNGQQIKASFLPFFVPSHNNNVVLFNKDKLENKQLFPLVFNRILRLLPNGPFFNRGPGKATHPNDFASLQNRG